MRLAGRGFTLEGKQIFLSAAMRATAAGDSLRPVYLLWAVLDRDPRFLEDAFSQREESEAILAGLDRWLDSRKLDEAQPAGSIALEAESAIGRGLMEARTISSSAKISKESIFLGLLLLPAAESGELAAALQSASADDIDAEALRAFARRKLREALVNAA